MSTQIANIFQELVNEVRSDAVLSGVFECYDDDELGYILASYNNFRLHLTTQAISNRSVILAAAHFVSLHGNIQRNMQATMARQVQKASPVEPIVKDVVNSKYGSNHWKLTSYGIEYESLSVAGNTFYSQSYGI